jgi:Ca-activated chloride channel homolog
MDSRAIRHLEIRFSSSRLIVLAALFMFAIAATWPVWPAAAQNAGTAPSSIPAPSLPAMISIDQVTSGVLLLRTEKPGRYLPAPTIMTKVDMKISGMVARVELRQFFHNPSKKWLEGIYAFPLPENASVDRMKLRVGDQEIEATIAERAKARKIYEKARRQGKRAALVEQHRPNIFTNSVANIGPGETVSVTLRYQQTLRYDSGQFRVRFPTVVAPRYMPGPMTATTVSESGWATQRKIVPDEPGLDSPVLPPEAGKINPLSITIKLDAGFPLTDLKSPHHKITSDDWSDGISTVTLAEGAVPADRDFELVWTPKTGTAPVAGIFRETIDGDTYLLAMVLPPAAPSGPVAPRDIVFVLDRSGSMGGDSIRQAKAAIALALKRLRPADRFNIIRFASDHDSLYTGLRPASVANLAWAEDYIRNTKAGGGTNMAPALSLALTGKRQKGRLKQIVFLTDGAVGNEAVLMKLIEQELGTDRLFTVGIGSAPNSYFMRHAARLGRGAFTHIGNQSQIASRMTELFEKLERPMVTDLSTTWNLGSKAGKKPVEVYPELPPDLYHGEPLMLAAKLPSPAMGNPGASLDLTGIFGGRQWRHGLGLTGAREGVGIGAIWGRAKIERLMDGLRRGGDRAKIRKAVVKTALRHHLMSAYTSLVAVQNEVSRPDGMPLATVKAPLNLPHGWNFAKVYGGRLKPSTPPSKRAAQASPSATMIGSGMIARELADAAAKKVMLPRGATPWKLHVMAGLTLLLFSVGLYVVRRRRVEQ